MDTLREFLSKQNSRRWWAVARKHDNSGNYEEAVRCYQKCLECDPEFFEAAFNLAVCLMKLGKHEEAIPAYERASEIRPEFEGVWLNMGRLYQRLGKPDKATECFDRALQLQPTYVKALLAKAEILLRQKNNTAAKRCIEAALEQEPYNRTALGVKATWLVAEKQYEEARTTLRELLSHDPLNSQARFLLEQVQAKIDTPDGPDIEMPPLMLAPATEEGQNLVDRALLQAAQGAEVAALATAREAVRRNPHSGEAWCVLGILLQRQKDYAGALNAIDRGLAESPTDAQAHNVRGECLARLGRFAEAVGAFRESERLGWHRPLLYRNLAVCLGRVGREGEARIAAAKAAELDPNLASTLPTFSWQQAASRQDLAEPHAEVLGDTQWGVHQQTRQGTVAAVPRMLLWFQLVRRGLFRKLLRFYGTLWLVSLIFMAVSLGMLLAYASAFPAQYGASWLWPLITVSSFMGGYVICTMYGPAVALILSILLPVVILGSLGSTVPDNWLLMGRGIMVFGGLFLLISVAYLLAPLPYWFVGYAGWPHRRAMSLVMVITGALGTELLRAVTISLPTVMFPWSGVLTRFFDTPVWALAIASWLWLNLGCVLSRYDAVILPPLLRRLGYSVPDHVTTEYASLVDKLAENLCLRDDL